MVEQEEIVLRALARTKVAITGREERREKSVEGVEGARIHGEGRREEGEGKQEQTERATEGTATERKAEEGREDQAEDQAGVETVVGVIDFPLGILLLYLVPHRCSHSAAMHDSRDISGGGDVTNNTKSNRRGFRKDGKRSGVPVSLPLLPFAFVDLKWLVHTNERQNMNTSRGNIPTWECVDRVVFIEGVLVVVTSTYASTPVSSSVGAKGGAIGGAVHASRSGEKRSDDERRANKRGESGSLWS